jgi:hypothetical protein
VPAESRGNETPAGTEACCYAIVSDRGSIEADKASWGMHDNFVFVLLKRSEIGPTSGGVMLSHCATEVVTTASAGCQRIVMSAALAAVDNVIGIRDWA